MPIGFLMTAIQQLVAFVAFCLFLFIGRAIGMNYEAGLPKQAGKRAYEGFFFCFSDFGFWGLYRNYIVIMVVH